MGFTALTCPSCGSQIELDDSREFGFCQYCGTKIVQDKIIVEHRGSVSIDRTDEINSLLARARQFYERGQLEEAEAYYDKVLDIDSNNIAAKTEIQKFYQIIREPNVTLRMTTGTLYNSSAAVKVKIDGVKYGEISEGIPGIYKLPVGAHIIRVSIKGVPGTKREIRVDIKDRFTKESFEIHCKFGNRIDVIRF